MKQSTWLLVGLSIVCILLGLLIGWILYKDRFASEQPPQKIEGFQTVIPTQKTSITVIEPGLIDALYDQVNLKRAALEATMFGVTTDVQYTTLEYALFYSDKDVQNALSLIMSHYNDSLQMYDFEKSAAAYVKNNLSTVEDILFTTMYGIPAMLEQNVFPKSWSEYALKVSGNNPFTARKFMITHYTTMDDLVLEEQDSAAYKTLVADKATWDWNSSLRDSAIRTRICTELETASDILRTNLETLRIAATDLSGSVQTAIYAKNENMGKQVNSMMDTSLNRRCTSTSPSADCRRLASIDSYLYDLLPDYDQANSEIYAATKDVMSQVQTLRATADMYHCPFALDLSGLYIPPSILNSATQQMTPNLKTIDLSMYTEDANPALLSDALNTLSPYFVSYDATNYVGRNLMSGSSGNSDPYSVVSKSYSGLSNIIGFL